MDNFLHENKVARFWDYFIRAVIEFKASAETLRNLIMNELKVDN